MPTRELTEADFAHSIRHSVRERLIRGSIAGGGDIVALRRFTGLTQAAFAEALGVAVETLQSWEAGRETPHGPALALLRIVARHPGSLQENLIASAQ